MYQKYNQLGLCVIPEKKGVPLFAWSEFMERLPTQPECESWEKSGHDGYGLVCGKLSGIIALDIDTDNQEVLDKVIALAGKSGLVKRGSKGRTLFYRYEGQPSKSWKQDGKVIVELLSDKRKTTIPPSKHRTSGKEYIWESENYSEIPLLGKGFVEMMEILFPSPKREVRAIEYVVEDVIGVEEIAELLDYCDPNMSYQDWVSIGMALRHEFGDAAFGLWDSWSSKGTAYKKNQMSVKWRSFNGDGYGIGTVVYFAQQGGWVKKYESVSHDDWKIDLSYLNKKTVKERKEIVAHGLVGEIADWITATASRPQPQLALGAALTFVGMVKGHKFETVTNLRTNLLVMNIAPSGGGKDDPLKAIDILASECGLDKHLLSEPTAGTSLLKGLKDDAGRVGLWAIDEFGRYLAHVTSKNSGNYQKEIIDYVIKMFGRASGTIRGKKFANEKLNPRINIVQPHLCVIGASVKEHITDNCTSKDAIDGFLNRWILFESVERPRMKIGKKRVEVPESIIRQIQKIIKDDPNGAYPLGDDDKPIVRQVRYTPEAYAMVQQYQEEVEDLIDGSTPLLQALYTRNYEHTTKVALILCDNEFIRVQDLELAIAIVAESNKLVVDLAGGISDNEQEKTVHKLLAIIKSHKLGISHSDLIRRSKFVNAKTRREILNDLTQSGEVKAEAVGKTFIYS
jgi:hypothetical protein